MCREENTVLPRTDSSESQAKSSLSVSVSAVCWWLELTQSGCTVHATSPIAQSTETVSLNAQSVTLESINTARFSTGTEAKAVGLEC